MKSNLKKIQLIAIYLLVCTQIIACTLKAPVAPSATAPARQTSMAPPGQEEWQTVLSIATKTQPILESNPTGEWSQTLLSENVEFSERLEVKLEVLSVGVNGILLTATKLGDSLSGVSWWKGHKRIEILYDSRVLNVMLRDGSKQDPVYLSQVQLEPDNNEVLIVFDPQARNIEIQQSGRTVMQISTLTVGDFPNGLFPEGKILTVELIHGPNSACSVTELEFLILVPDGAASAQ